jgi:hypothetical protein
VVEGGLHGLQRQLVEAPIYELLSDAKALT